MFRFAHLTDPHVGPLPRPRLRELLSKRLTGYINWHRGRGDSHDMTLLAALVADIKTQAPDHIACTGDVCNIGLKSEWRTSRVFLDGLGSPHDVTFVPGNHDAYVPGSLAGLMKEVGPYAMGDEGRPGKFPFLRRRGSLAILGMSSAVPTPPFLATGTCGRKQFESAESLLARAYDEGAFRIVLIHHPPHRGGAPQGRDLTDARGFERMIGRVGAELVLHGHNHVGSVASIPGPQGPVPIIGAPSASSRGGAFTHRAGYHLYTVRQESGAFTVQAERRGLMPDGTIGDLGVFALKAPR